MVTTPIRTEEDIEQIKAYFLRRKEYRDYTLFIMGINTALRISDLLCLKWGNVYDFGRKAYAAHIYLTEQKTQKQTCIALNENCVQALKLLKRGSIVKAKDYIFYSGCNKNMHISRNRAYHIIKDAATAVNIDGNISCHSLRKTFGYHAWKKGTPPALIMSIYNHSSIEVTKKYLCIEQDDKDEVFLTMNL